MEAGHNETIVITILYSKVPALDEMLSEKLMDLKLPADVIKTERKKFYEWKDCIAIARSFHNEQRE